MKTDPRTTKQTLGYRQRINRLENEADLNVLRGQIQGIEYVKASLCSCELKPAGREWLEKQIDSRKIRLKILEDERTTEP